MKKTIINQLKNIIRLANLNVSKYSTQVTRDQLLEKLHLSNQELLSTVARAKNNIPFLLQIPDRDLLPWVFESQAQLWQDLFVLHELKMKKNGFFVEFGATNGKSLSNTYMLEKQFEWKGILAEPARRWHHELSNNRTVAIEKKCVWSKSGEVLVFNETEVAELSTIDSFSASDYHETARKNGVTYSVETITLLDLLKKYQAPKIIDYLSIDTEGSEYEILKNFDFAAYKFKVITCEHNYSPDREKIRELLKRHGYIAKYPELSEFDDWYVLA
jgi:FkbM family methyltransferase